MKTRTRVIILAAAAVAAAAFIFFGVHRGEASVIFQNAAAICLECIGLGK